METEEAAPAVAPALLNSAPKVTDPNGELSVVSVDAVEVAENVYESEEFQSFLNVLANATPPSNDMVNDELAAPVPRPASALVLPPTQPRPRRSTAKPVSSIVSSPSPSASPAKVSGKGGGRLAKRRSILPKHEKQSKLTDYTVRITWTLR